MKHLCVAAAALLLMAGTAAGLAAIGAASTSAGTVWVFTRGQDAGFRAVQGLPGIRVVNHWGRGHVLQLQADSLAALRWPAGTVWLAVPIPQRLFALAACG